MRIRRVQLEADVEVTERHSAYSSLLYSGSSSLLLHYFEKPFSRSPPELRTRGPHASRPSDHRLLHFFLTFAYHFPSSRDVLVSFSRLDLFFPGIIQRRFTFSTFRAVLASVGPLLTPFFFE